MKNLRFLLVAILVSSGIAYFSEAKAAATAYLPLCRYEPGGNCPRYDPVIGFYNKTDYQTCEGSEEGCDFP